MEKLVSIGVTHYKDFPADQLRVSIDLSGHFDDRSACTREYNLILTQVRDALTKIGIPADSIKNSDYTVSAHKKLLYVRQDDRYYHAATEIDGYDYSASISVNRDADSEEAKAIWIALCSCDNSVQFKLSYGLKDEEQLKATLLAEAVSEGRRRAEILANAAGAQLAGIHSIGYEYDGDCDYGLACACSPSAADDSAPDFNPEDVGIECRVNMQWVMDA